MTGDALFDVPGRMPSEAGRHERALRRAVDVARDRGVLEEIDDGLISLALANAAGLDAAERGKNPAYPIAQITGGYLDVLRSLAITPEGRVTQADDELTQALAELSKTSMGDA